MPSRKKSRERASRSASKSPKAGTNRRSTSATPQVNRSNTPPRSASPGPGRRRIVKGASVRDSERSSSIRSERSSSIRAPRRKGSTTEFNSTRSSVGSTARSASPIRASSRKISSEPTTKSKAPFKRMNSIDNPRAPSRISSLGPSTPSSTTSSSSQQQPRQPTRMNSLGNPGASQRIRTNQPNRMHSLGIGGGQQRSGAPRRTTSLDPGARIRSGAPRRTNSVGPSPSRVASTRSPKVSPKLSPNKSSSRVVRMDPPIVASIKPPSLGRIPKDDTIATTNNKESSEMVTENMKSHRLTPSRFKRWGFGGGMSSDDDEYGDSFRMDLATLAKSKANTEPTGALQEYDSDSDYSIGMTGDPESLPPPNTKRNQSRLRSMNMFPDDKWWQKCLRHFRILPPVPNEGRTRRSVRRLIWATLIFDALVAIVTVATFSGTVTMCCNQATMATIPTIDWNLFVKVVAYIYLVGIFLEIHPVVREGPIPWNLLNPIFGTLLSFAVFVDDSKVEAIGIWILEITSVILEMFTYRKLRKLYQREERRLEKLDDALNGDQDALYRKGGQYKQNAYLRERRLLRIEHAENKSKLRYHFVGVTVNFVLVGFTLLLMIVVARGQGMCLVADEGLDLFHPDQRSRCNLCEADSNGWSDRCQICKDGPNEDPSQNDPIQCYYPYF